MFLWTIYKVYEDNNLILNVKFDVQMQSFYVDLLLTILSIIALMYLYKPFVTKVTFISCYKAHY